MQMYEDMINLHHPCRGIDVWRVYTLEDMKNAMRQGYVKAPLLRKLLEEYICQSPLTREYQDEVIYKELVLYGGLGLPVGVI